LGLAYFLPYAISRISSMILTIWMRASGVLLINISLSVIGNIILFICAEKSVAFLCIGYVILGKKG